MPTDNEMRQTFRQEFQKLAFKRDIAEVFFQGNKRAMGSNIPRGSLRGKSLEEVTARDWCPHIQRATENAPVKFRFTTDWDEDGCEWGLKVVNKNTGALIHLFGPYPMMGNFADGGEIHKKGRRMTIKLNRMVDRTNEKVVELINANLSPGEDPITLDDLPWLRAV